MPNIAWRQRVVAALTQSIAYWAVVLLLRDQPVVPLAWIGLYGLCVVGAQVLVSVAARDARALASPLAVVISLILAALFWGADAGRKLIDADYADYAQHHLLLGGLELWWVLCPGLASILLAACTLNVKRTSRRTAGT